jgi:hypothetical protein
MNWQTFFESVPDFRKDRRKKHHLVDILVIQMLNGEVPLTTAIKL